MEKVIFYHTGPKPAEEDVKLLNEARVSYEGRNADEFKASELEDSPVILIDEGDRGNEIRTAYQARADVTFVADYVRKVHEKSRMGAEDIKSGNFNPDAPLRAPRMGSQPPAEVTGRPLSAEEIKANLAAAKAQAKANADAQAKAEKEAEEQAKADAEAAEKAAKAAGAK